MKNSLLEKKLDSTKNDAFKDIFAAGYKLGKKSKGKISIIRFSQDQFSLLTPLWKEISKSIENPRFTISLAWIEKWIKVYGDTVKYQFYVGIKDNSPLGIIFLTQETQRVSPIPVRAFHIGTYGEPFSDSMQMVNNTILVKPGFEQAFYEAFLDEFIASTSYDEIYFDELVSKDVDILIPILKKKKYRFYAEEEPMLYLNLEQVRQSNQPLNLAFSSSMRQAIKRTLKALDDLEIEWAEDYEHAMDIFSELVDIYNKDMKAMNRLGKFASKRYTQFQKEIINSFIKHDNRVMLFRVKSKKHGTLGCFYFLIDRGIAYLIQMGVKESDEFALETISKNRLKIGYLLHALCMETCLQRGLKGYSFSIGIFRYKMQLTNAQETITTITVYKGFKPVLRNIMYSLLKKLDSKRKASIFIRIIRKITEIVLALRKKKY